MTAEVQTFKQPCENAKVTRCNGFSGGYDTYICDKPCRLNYRMRTNDYVRDADA